jgi:hypothetical protein
MSGEAKFFGLPSEDAKHDYFVTRHPVQLKVIAAVQERARYVLRDLPVAGDHPNG